MPLSYAEALGHTDRLYRVLAARRREVEELESYYRGDHPLRFMSEEWAHDHERRFRGFSDNWCGVVGSAPGERTEVRGFRVGEDSDPIDDAERGLWRDWTLNDMDAQASQGFLQSTIAKRSAVLVWGDSDDNPVVTWEHPSQMVVEADVAVRRNRRFALKAWLDGDRELATLYTPDEVWKFERPAHGVESTTNSGLLVVTGYGSQAAGWQERAGEDVNPVPNPFGLVPAVEMPNRPMLRGEPISDIAGTRAMQDAINLLWAYLFAAADFASMPQRVVMGQQPPKVPVLDANGQVVGERVLEDLEPLRKARLLYLSGQHASIGNFPSADLAKFTDVINVCARHIAAQTKTPLHLIHGELGNVNGETLTGLESPLVAKVRESHKFYTSPIREVFRLMALVRGDRGLAEACRVGNVLWANPETKSDAQVADAALKDSQTGVLSRETILETRYGMSPEQVSRELSRLESQDALVASVLRPVQQPGEPAPLEG